MPPVISCASCGLKGRLPEGFSERPNLCPSCGNVLTVFPETNGAAAVVDAGVETPLGEPSRPQQEGSCMQNLSSSPGETETDLPNLEPHLSDMQAEREWLREERQRFDQYLAEQFEQLQRQRQELAAWQTRIEAKLVARDQELNRRQKHLAQRQAELPDPPRADASTATESAALQERLSRGRQELEDVCRQRDQARQELEQLQQAVAHARVEWRSLEDTIRKRKQNWEAEEARWQGQVKNLQERQAALVRAEQSLQKRQLEIRDLEKQIYDELEKQEQRLVLERQDLERRKQELTSGQEGDALRRRLARLVRDYETKLNEARQDQDQRRLELEQTMRENENLRHKVAMLSRDVERLRTQLYYYQAPRPRSNRPGK